MMDMHRPGLNVRLLIAPEFEAMEQHRGIQPPLNPTSSWRYGETACAIAGRVIENYIKMPEQSGHYHTGWRLLLVKLQRKTVRIVEKVKRLSVNGSTRIASHFTPCSSRCFTARSRSSTLKARWRRPQASGRTDAQAGKEKRTVQSHTARLTPDRLSESRSTR